MAATPSPGVISRCPIAALPKSSIPTTCPKFERAADARLDAEDAVLPCDEIDYKTKLAILAAGGVDVAPDLARVAGCHSA
ncbi:MAG: hypothetical protein WAV38_37650 [Xanthobacteraceae bacterium]